MVNNLNALLAQTKVGALRTDDDTGRRVLMERPLSNHPDDAFLSFVLVELSNGDYVTWVYNGENGGYTGGAYFKHEQFPEAVQSFLERH